MSNDPIQPLTAAQRAEVEQSAAQEGYVHRVLVQADILGEVILDGPPDRTISTELADMDQHDTGIKHEIGKIGSEVLNLFEADHGEKARIADEWRGQNVVNLEKAADFPPTKQ